jgi:PAS domain S-box-containing protein
MTALQEELRLAGVHRLGLLSPLLEERFTRITDIACRLLRVPKANVNLVDADRLWPLTSSGPADADLTREASLCTYVVQDRAPVVVTDVASSERFRDCRLLVGDRPVRSYLGWPLFDQNEVLVATLCVFDVKERHWSPEDQRALAQLAGWAELELCHEQVQKQLAQGARAQRLSDSVIASAGEGICGIDLEGRVTRVNAAAGRITGWAPGDLVGMPFHETLHGRRPDGSHYPADECALRQSLRQGVRVARVDDVYWRKDGIPFPTRLSLAPIVEEDGAVTGAVTVFEDVTAQRELEKLKENFVSVVSHELRTPLTSLRGSLGLLASGVAGDLPPDAAEMVGIAATNTDRLVRLVGELLDLERLGAGVLPLDRARNDVADIVRQAVTSVAALAAEAHVEVRADVTAGHAWCDSDRIVQVLVNLLGNAVKFSPPGSVVALTARPYGQSLRFDVADTGRGIPPDKLEHIFDRFAQVHVDNGKSGGGTGLGLAIARSIVQSHGGTIEVSSSEQRGTCFRVTVPQRNRKTPATGNAARRKTDG